MYTRGSAIYSVIATGMPSRHQGELTKTYIESPGFMVEAHQHFVFYLIILQVYTGYWWWYIMVCYLVPY